MKLRRLSLLACLCLGVVGAVGEGAASPMQVSPVGGGFDLPVTPVVVFGKNSRETIDQFATAEGLKTADVRARHAASGIVACGEAHGAGQLTLADDVITTAAHVLFDESGAPRAKVCVFKLTLADGREIRVPIDSSTIVAGSTDPYAIDAVHDWAVAKLKQPVDGPQPIASPTMSISARSNLPPEAMSIGATPGSSRSKNASCRSNSRRAPRERANFRSIARRESAPRVRACSTATAAA